MKLQFLRFDNPTLNVFIELYFLKKWRAKLMFERYPEIPKAYELLTKLTDIFNHCKCREETFKKAGLK